MQKIIFFDIDGTLVTYNNILPDSTREAISRLQSNGHIPVLSTGRPPKMLEAIANELNIDSFISLNGQYIVVQGQQLFATPLPTDEIEQLIETSYEMGDRAFLLTKDAAIGNNLMNEMLNDPEFVTFVYSNLNQLPIDVSAELFKRMSEKPLNRERYEMEDVLSAYIHTSEEHDVFYQERFSNFHFTRATPYMGEVLQKGSHKAAGMKRIVEFYGKGMENSVAFGDSLNDIEMIGAADIGVAMGNGRQEVKAVADYVTASVEEDGIYRGLEYLSLI